MNRYIKIVLLILIMPYILYSETTTIVPYGVMVDYDKNLQKSISDTAKIIGIYVSKKDKKYRIDAEYSNTNIKYKYDSIQNLKQDDLTIVYNRYFNQYFLKIGLHHINTTDADLGDSDTLIIALGKNNITKNGIYSYSIEGFYTYYKDGHDEYSVKKPIKIVQISPSFSFYKRISRYITNNIGFKINYQNAKQYSKKSYISYKIEDTISYKKLFTTFKLCFGEMKSGVDDGGHIVYNSKDLLKRSYKIKVGYYIKPNTSIAISYENSLSREYGKVLDSTSDMSSISLNHNF